MPLVDLDVNAESLNFTSIPEKFMKEVFHLHLISDLSNWDFSHKNLLTSPFIKKFHELLRCCYKGISFGIT